MLETQANSVVWRRQTEKGAGLDTGGVLLVGDLVVLQNNKDSIEIVSASDGEVVKVLNVVGGASGVTWLDNAIYAFNGSTKWTSNKDDWVRMNHMVMFTPYGD